MLQSSTLEHKANLLSHYIVSCANTTKSMLENIVDSLVTSIRRSSKLLKAAEIKKVEICLVLSSQRHKISRVIRIEIFKKS